jgi:YfiH family protein
MLRFESLERLGISLAAISGLEEGDCSVVPKSPSSFETYLKNCGTSSKELLRVRQVHGDHILRVENVPPWHGLDRFDVAIPEADGLITTSPDLTLAITVADCVPVFVVSTKPRVVALIHAGREGTLLDITAKAVGVLKKHYDVDLSRLHGLIGPSIGPCCYEVSTVQSQAFAKRGFPCRGRYLDLWEANARALRSTGVSPQHIEVSGHCTCCGGGFFSYRADHSPCRNLALLKL